MRKWKSTPTSTNRGAGSAPNDPGGWSDVSLAMPSGRGTYQSADVYATEAEKTATGEGPLTPKYAFAASTPTASISYLIGTKIWEVPSDAVGGVLTDRTNGRTIGSFPHMTQFGNATICAMGNTNDTLVATGGNFTAIAGAPDAEIVLTQSNAVLAFNTDAGADGWAASDVGDHTNWSTGESASGRFLQTPGPVVAAVAFRDVVYVWKGNSIYRGRYVGGAVKWAWEVVCWHLGMKDALSKAAKWAIAACKTGVAFLSSGTSAEGGFDVHFFDGANPPRKLNHEVTFPESFSSSAKVVFLYDAQTDRLTVSKQANSISKYHYSFSDDAWGRSVSGLQGTSLPAIVQGTSFDIAKHYSGSFSFTLPTVWGGGTNNDKVHKLYPVGNASNYAGGTASFDIKLIGSVERKTNFSRLTPVLWVKERNNGETGVITLTASVTNELHTPSSTSVTVTLSANHQRFDLTNATGNFFYGTLSFPDMYVEIADVHMAGEDAGEE